MPYDRKQESPIVSEASLAVPVYNMRIITVMMESTLVTAVSQYHCLVQLLPDVLNADYLEKQNSVARMNSPRPTVTNNILL